ncbi:dNTP triphosphohydrolase [Mesorhizobium tamadayense]|uniref:Deoxyguanosinetriphosphate triphosphohydrolase-like protein n=1 Tax=Mesorhizobium tamadayense TaxID=425306 RepID=A0A3P3FFJ5_9HYPH|nr:dNTP triphosphohydrolase [Mesorhizobium tamadayense]RRH96902.1 dNTP triphosphohydrolase [Mesorhizobium tamadayense]
MKTTGTGQTTKVEISPQPAKPLKPLYRKEDETREVTKPDDHDKEWRDNYTRDYGRIVHSASFRRQQGKTQVFPGHESDFFRNRLTHSLEVAQIAQGIAERLNHRHPEVLKHDPIKGSLCATASLVHDIGHPPFGHNGERALDKAMLQYGGFEGNAQTFRILTRLEKKERYKTPVGGDDRAGLNLCHRTLAATLKYDKRIATVRKSDAKLEKGYYGSESEIIANIKRSVLGDYQLPKGKQFKTIECAIMDMADDIAYSVYDLEDCLKVGFLTPAEMLASDDALLDEVAAAVSKQMGEREAIGRVDVQAVLIDIFSEIGEAASGEEDGKSDNLLLQLTRAYKASRKLSEDGYARTQFSSELVHRFIEAVELDYNEECPALSDVIWPREIRLRKEVLKQYTFIAAIYAPRVKLGEYRGYDLVSDIFEALMGDRGDLLMPADVRERIRKAAHVSVKAREVCDFVAGMTDRYAMEFWARLNSDTAESMFKPI